MRTCIICLMLLFAGSVFAQAPVNQVDSQGRKQGAWEKRNSYGGLIYQAVFKDDKPVGETKRFHPNGKPMAILKHADGTDMSDAQLFDENGQLIARGKYQGQKKIGEWEYLSGNKIILIEAFVDGKKSGVAKRFYPTGELLEESNWNNGQPEGVFRSYFKDGKTFIECKYVNGKRNGLLNSWFSNGTLEMEAGYFDDVPDKEWKYYTENGDLRYTLKYEKGKLLNPEVLDSIDKGEGAIFKPRGRDIPDPEKFMQNPEEYMRLMQK